MPIPVSPVLSNYILVNFLELLQVPNGFEPTFIWVIGKWADIADQLLSTVTPASTTAIAARQSFMATLTPLESDIPNGVLLLEQAFLEYASVLAEGMSEAGFIGTPPPTIPSISSITSVNQTYEQFATLLENILIPWAKTGTATPIISGPTINWN